MCHIFWFPRSIRPERVKFTITFCLHHSLFSFTVFFLLILRGIRWLRTQLKLNCSETEGEAEEEEGREEEGIRKEREGEVEREVRIWKLSKMRSWISRRSPTLSCSLSFWCFWSVREQNTHMELCVFACVHVQYIFIFACFFGKIFTYANHKWIKALLFAATVNSSAEISLKDQQPKGCEVLFPFHMSPFRKSLCTAAWWPITRRVDCGKCGPGSICVQIYCNCLSVFASVSLLLSKYSYNQHLSAYLFTLKYLDYY